MAKETYHMAKETYRTHILQREAEAAAAAAQAERDAQRRAAAEERSRMLAARVVAANNFYGRPKETYSYAKRDLSIRTSYRERRPKRDPGCWQWACQEKVVRCPGNSSLLLTGVVLKSPCRGDFSTTPVSSKEELTWTPDNFLLTCPLPARVVAANNFFGRPKMMWIHRTIEYGVVVTALYVIFST